MKLTAMKTKLIIPAILLLSAMACNNNTTSKTNSADTTKTDTTAKSDTAIVPGNQKSIKNDSLSGDPSSKGSADPNAKLPKK